MRAPRLAVPMLVMLLAVPVTFRPALGADAVAPDRLEIVPNFNAASVYAHFTGDSNRNASVKMEYRAGDAKAFRPGHPLARTGPGRFAGSIFWLGADQPLEVRVTFEDPDGLADGAQNILAAATRTRSDRFPAGKGKTYFVGPEGDDAADGADRTKALKTIQHAVDLAAPGDTIVLVEGAYSESVTVKRSGRPDAYITLRADTIRKGFANENGAERESEPARIVGWDRPKGEWQRVGENLFSIDEKRGVGTLTLDDRRAYHHGALEELQGAEPVLVPGWWQDAKAGKLYFRTKADRPPASGAMRLGVLRTGLLFEETGYWVVEGLTFEVFGGGPYSRGIEVLKSRNIIVRGCAFDTMWVGVWVRKAESRDCLIERCAFRDSGIWDWPWKAVKGHDTEGCAISLEGGPGNVARFNTIQGHFNGIGASTWGDLENEALNRDMDVHDNTFTEIGDDPMEPEGACMNVRFWNNRTLHTLQGISLAPITVGPTYVVRDRYVDFTGGAVKASVSSKGVVYLYHVLGWTDRPERAAMDPSGPWGNFHFRNTILRGTRYALEDMRPHTAPSSFDYSCLFTTDTTRFAKWGDKRYPSLKDLVAAEPEFGKHLLAAEPYTGAEDGVPADLRPALIDAGVLIPGINDDFKGKAPDIGPDEVR